MADVENFQACLRMLIDLRAKTTEALKATSDGITAQHGDSGREKKFLSELKLKLDTINNQIKELEQKATPSQIITNPLPLGHTVYLSMDHVPESTPIYNSLTESYKWLDKAHEYAEGAASLLGLNNLGRTYNKISRSRRRGANTSHTAAPQTLDQLIEQTRRSYKDMSFLINRPNGTLLNSIVHLSLGRVLKGVLVFKGLMIEWVVIRGYNEETNIESEADVWVESDYQIFRRVTDNANAAMLNFNSAMYPELAVKSFFIYLHSFITLFTEKCRKCGHHLHNNLPPTWREYKTLEPYHEDCKP